MYQWSMEVVASSSPPHFNMRLSIRLLLWQDGSPLIVQSTYLLCHSNSVFPLIISQINEVWPHKIGITGSYFMYV